jgi:hypothetical protein
MTRKHVTSLLAACAMLAASPHAQALAEETDSRPTIVVTGRPELTEEKTLEIVRRVTQPVDGQLARFEKPICPRVTGFQPEYEELVAKRIRAVAETVGAGAGEEGCIANLNVVIVDDGGEFVTELHRQHPEALEGLSKPEIVELANFDGVARSWAKTALTNSVGATVGRPSPTAGGGSVKWGYQGSSVHFGDVNVMRVYESSNIDPSVQQAIVSAWVVLDTRATIGKSLTQIADYAAVRGMAMVRPAELDGSEETILALFESGSTVAPAAMAEFDRAYLKSLYRIQGRASARKQVQQMATSIAREAPSQK